MGGGVGGGREGCVCVLGGAGMRGCVDMCVSMCVWGVWTWLWLWSDRMEIVIIVFVPINALDDNCMYVIDWYYSFYSALWQVIYYYIFYLNNACGICMLLHVLRLWISYTCKFYSFVCCSCVAPTFSFVWNKKSIWLEHTCAMLCNNKKSVIKLEGVISSKLFKVCAVSVFVVFREQEKRQQKTKQNKTNK